MVAALLNTLVEQAPGILPQPQLGWGGETTTTPLHTSATTLSWEVEVSAYLSNLCVGYIHGKQNTRYACNPDRNPAMTDSTGAGEHNWDTNGFLNARLEPALNNRALSYNKRARTVRLYTVPTYLSVWGGENNLDG